MKEIIQNTVAQVETDLKSNIDEECLCDLKTIRYDQGTPPDYSKKKIQQLYLLRYYPAYLCEYTYLYRKVIASRKLRNLSILSIGCGCCVDYHGAYLAKGSDFSEISFWGIDLFDWDYKYSLGNPNFSTFISNIKDVELPSPNDFNVIIFPKSISEFDDDSFNSFLQKMSNSEFTQNKIFLISSSMDKGFKYDEQRYNKVMRVLNEQGFDNKEYSPTSELKNKGWLGHLINGFYYPEETKIFLESLSNNCVKFIKNGHNCELDCKEQLNKNPILTGRHISFQINLLER